MVHNPGSIGDGRMPRFSLSIDTHKSPEKNGGGEVSATPDNLERQIAQYMTDHAWDETPPSRESAIAAIHAREAASRAAISAGAGTAVAEPGVSLVAGAGKDLEERSAVIEDKSGGASSRLIKVFAVLTLDERTAAANKAAKRALPQSDGEG